MAQPKRKNSASYLDLAARDGFVPEMGSPNGVLTGKQRAFVYNLVHLQMTKSAAARAAGCGDAGNAAAKMLLIPRVRKAIAEEQKKYAKASGMTKQKVIEGFLESIDIGRIKADPIAMIAGFREIGKMCGFYEPTKTRIEVSMSGKVLLDRLQTLSDAELLQLSAENPEILDGEFSIIEKPGTED